MDEKDELVDKYLDIQSELSLLKEDKNDLEETNAILREDNAKLLQVKIEKEKLETAMMDLETFNIGLREEIANLRRKKIGTAMLKAEMKEFKNAKAALNDENTKLRNEIFQLENSLVERVHNLTSHLKVENNTLSKETRIIASKSIQQRIDMAFDKGELRRAGDMIQQWEKVSHQQAARIEQLEDYVRARRSGLPDDFSVVVAAKKVSPLSAGTVMGKKL